MLRRSNFLWGQIFKSYSIQLLQFKYGHLFQHRKRFLIHSNSFLIFIISISKLHQIKKQHYVFNSPRSIQIKPQINWARGRGNRLVKPFETMHSLQLISPHGSFDLHLILFPFAWNNCWTKIQSGVSDQDYEVTSTTANKHLTQKTIANQICLVDTN